MSGHITALTVQKKNRERVSVYLDGTYAFGLPRTEAEKLRKGQFLHAEEIAALRTLDLRARAYERALRLLARRPRSSREIRENLGRYRPSKEREPLANAHIEWVVSQLTERGYLDDEEFARYWVEQRNRFKPRSARALRFELTRKGIQPDLAARVIEDLCDPEDACARAARQRAPRWCHLGEEAFRTKMGSYLQRRGFRWSLIREVVDQVWQECTHGQDLEKP